MKLMFVIKTLQEIAGGSERVLSQITGALAARGHEITIITYDPKEAKPFYTFDPAVRILNLAVGDAKHKARFLETLQRMLALRHIVAQEKPDVIIGFMHSAFVPAALALVGSGIPVIASEHIVPAHYKGKPLESFLFLLSSFFIARYTVLSKAIRALYPPFLQPKMIPIANPVSIPKEQHPHSNFLLLSVGRLDPQKDFKTLIAAFAKIAGRHPSWHLRIVGEGSLRADLEKQIAALGLGERISLPGKIKDITSQYDEAGLLVLSSLYESFGLACAEALAHGLPAIAFANCTGLSELIQTGKNGVLVDPAHDRTQALADTLNALMSDANRRNVLSRQAPASVAHYSLSSVTDAWEGLLSEVVATQFS